MKITFKDKSEDSESKEYILPKINKIKQIKSEPSTKEVYSFVNSRYSQYKFTDNPFKTVTLSAFHKNFEQYFSERDAAGQSKFKN